MKILTHFIYAAIRVRNKRLRANKTFAVSKNPPEIFVVYAVGDMRAFIPIGKKSEFEISAVYEIKPYYLPVVVIGVFAF